MACYIISYDLQSDSDYAQLYSALKSYGTWAKITESTWAVVTQQTASEIRDYLTAYIADGDRLFVVKSGVEAAWRNTICENNWLKKNL